MEEKKVRKSSNKQAVKDRLALNVYDTDGKIVGVRQLPKEIFSVTASGNLLAQSVRVHLANCRKGTASTKNRGEVRGGGRKPWRQKGTGRARAGSIRDPQWRGGGVVFGPKPRDFSLSLSKRMKRLALFGSLSAKLKEKKIICVDGLSKLSGKTKEFSNFLTKTPIVNDKNKKILLILAKKSEKVARSVKNIKNLSLVTLKNLNSYQILKNDFLLFDKEALAGITNLITEDSKNG